MYANMSQVLQTLLNMYVNIYVHMHISRPPMLAVTTDQEKFLSALVENINLAITIEIYFIELALSLFQEHLRRLLDALEPSLVLTYVFVSKV